MIASTLLLADSYTWVWMILGLLLVLAMMTTVHIGDVVSGGSLLIVGSIGLGALIYYIVDAFRSPWKAFFTAFAFLAVFYFLYRLPEDED